MIKKKRQFDFLDQSFHHRVDGLPAGQWSGKELPGCTLSLSRGRLSKEPQVHKNDVVPDPMLTRSIVVVVNGRDFSITGNVVSCTCPDCGALMSVRLWLGTADCWRCDCSIELDRSEVSALLEQIGIPESKAGIEVEAPATGLLTDPDREPGWPGINPASEIAIQENRLPGLRWLELLPAWLISFLAHLLMIVILALMALNPALRERAMGQLPIDLVLSPFVSEKRIEGEAIRIAGASESDVVDSTRGEADDSLSDPADIADAIEIRNDPSPNVRLPTLDAVRQRIRDDGGKTAALAARDPRLREELVYREGGTTETEAAVARGLRWLASVQNNDGSWSLANYSRNNRPDNRGDAAGTGLALLPFLGAGQTHEFGMYKETVARGLQWLLENQKSDGDLRINFPQQSGMYAHGQCAIVLCESYAMTGDERFRIPAQKAIQFIVDAQHRAGGWRYQPGDDGDLSVFGWQLMALQSARELNSLNVPPITIDRAGRFLDSVGAAMRRDPYNEDGILYRYRPREGSVTQAMTAEAMLCRLYLGWQRNDPRVMRAMRWMLREHPPSEEEADIYYWYYATQAFHHYGGNEWSKWNGILRELLVDMQTKRGRNAGSWEPGDFEWGSQGGRIFTTSFAVCTLEVYYRRLPLFRNIEFDD